MVQFSLGGVGRLGGNGSENFRARKGGGIDPSARVIASLCWILECLVTSSRSRFVNETRDGEGRGKGKSILNVGKSGEVAAVGW